MKKISAQEYADMILDPKYRQSLKSLAEALDVHGWEHVDRPTCCGSELDIRSFLGSPYFVQCKSCGKFAVSATGPTFGNAWVNLVDSNKVDTDTDNVWATGVQPVEEIAAVSAG